MGPTAVAEIAREHDCLPLRVELHKRRPQDVARIVEPEADIPVQGDLLPVLELGPKEVEGGEGVGRGVEGVLSFFFLDPGGVHEHRVGDVPRRPGADPAAAEPLPEQARDEAEVVEASPLP